VQRGDLNGSRKGKAGGAKAHLHGRGHIRLPSPLRETFLEYEMSLGVGKASFGGAQPWGQAQQRLFFTDEVTPACPADGAGLCHRPTRRRLAGWVVVGKGHQKQACPAPLGALK
jgi:hypothetical protein